MRLLHTSDWHIGRTFHGRALLGDQEQTLAAVADLVRDERIDVVLIAGDLYDRAVPSVDAVQLATRALRRIRDAGAEIVLSTGNHDSAARLGAFGDFLAAGGLHIRSSVDQLDVPVMFSDAHGEVAVYGIPYLEPDIARQSMQVPDARGHAGVLGEAMSRIRADLAGRPAGTRSVVLSHAFVVGGAATDSERCIDTAEPSAGDALFEFKRGTVGSVPGDTFRGVDYVALGHLHRRQQLGARLRYSGSPLPYSFSEAGQTKGGWIVDLGAGGTPTVRAFDLPVVRPLATVRGTLAEVLAGHAELRGHYLAVELTDAQRPTDPMRRLLEVFPYAVTMAWQPPATTGPGPDFHISRRGLPDDALVDAFLGDCRGSGLTPGERTLVATSLTAARIAEAAA
ncbi:exonuclease SbcCD subunit D [Nakamurella deserti]|uniref:exonuclease SbcCD subunit D n=1 Tax=Nakamurella deserti TaxID=2164074 RepID=UPI000DBE52DE|nr:exonuclease SbcCD subunit D [Nakamurella deserti]